MLTALLGGFGAVLEITALLVRVVETKRAKSLSGLSSEFVWLSIALNACWAAYGGFSGLPAILWPSLLAIPVYLYAAIRIHRSGRPQWRLGAIGVTAAALVAVLAAVNVEAAGYLGGVAAVGTMIPQAAKLWITKDGAGVAPWAWLTTLSFSLVWLAYGALMGLTPLWLTNLVGASICLVVLAGYWRATRKAA